jgi:hypothetical protein
VKVKRNKDRTHIIAEPNLVAVLTADAKTGLGLNPHATAKSHKFAIAVVSVVDMCCLPVPARDRNTENRIHLSDRKSVSIIIFKMRRMKSEEEENTYRITSLEVGTVEETKGVATSLDLLVDLLRCASEVRFVREDVTGNGAAGFRAGGGRLRASSGRETRGGNRGDPSQDGEEDGECQTHGCSWS